MDLSRDRGAREGTDWAVPGMGLLEGAVERIRAAPALACSASFPVPNSEGTSQMSASGHFLCINGPGKYWRRVCFLLEEGIGGMAHGPELAGSSPRWSQKQRAIFWTVSNLKPISVLRFAIMMV